MQSKSLIYRNAAFTLNGDSVYQDKGNYATVQPDGCIHTVNDGKLTKWCVPQPNRSGLHYHGDFNVLNQTHALAVAEAHSLLTLDGSIRTGANWPSVWTRDNALATHAGLALWDPHVCRTALQSRIAHGEIEQDTGTGGSWPISTDRIVWALAAWEYFCVTGDLEQLQHDCNVLEQSCRRDLQVAVNEHGLMKGESSLLDWREQSYPAWMTAADIGDSCSLSTNILHAAAWRILADMFTLLKQKRQAQTWYRKSQQLRHNIVRSFRILYPALYGQFIYGRGYPVLSHGIDTLGNLLAILTGHTHGQAAEKIVAALPHYAFGVPCIHPQMPQDVPAYHNMTMWPVIEGYYAQAAAMVKNTEALTFSLACLIRAALMCRTHKENISLLTGTEQGVVLSSDSQLWSIAGMMGAVSKGLFGLRLSPTGLTFAPCVPPTLHGEHHLHIPAYRHMAIDLHMVGSGSRIHKFYINGKQSPALLPADLQGEVQIKILLEHADYKPTRVHLAQIIHRLDYPQGVKRTATGLAWEPVPNATFYKVFRNGVFMTQTNRCECAVTEPGSYQIAAWNDAGQSSFLNAPFEVDMPCIHSYPHGTTLGDAIDSSLTEHTDISCTPVQITQAGTYRINALFANGTYHVTDGNTCALRSLYLNGKRMGTLAFPHTSQTDRWNYFMPSGAIDLVLEPGSYTVELKYDTWAQNMNRAVNRFRLQELRFWLKTP